MDHLSKLFGSVFGLSAFSVAVIAGIAAGNAATPVLFKALVCMMVCYVVGTLLGLIADYTVAEHAREYAAARTIPELPSVAIETNSTDEDASGVHAGQRAG